jgi:hypothetical protein
MYLEQEVAFKGGSGWPDGFLKILPKISKAQPIFVKINAILRP